MRSTATNTILLGGFMASSIVYTATKAAPLSIQGIIMFALMLIFIGWNASRGVKFSTSDALVVLGSIFYYSGYLLFIDARLENIALYLSSIIFFVTLQKARVDGRKIAVALIVFWLLSIVLHPIELLNSFTATRVVDYFSGFFDNSNTFAAYSTVVFSSTFIFVENRRVRWFIAVVFFVMLFAHHSRNTLLFVLLSFIFYFLFTKGKGRLVPWLFFTIIAGALLFLIVIEPNLAALDLTVFGKGADTAGRSAQVLSVINNFDIRWMGNGLDTISEYTHNINSYALHNAWVNTLYSMGVIYCGLYVLFVRGVYRNIPIIAKSFLLSSHIYFFFEPGLFFSILMVSSFPIIVVIISQNKYENRPLYL
ncbi:hypothetical protein [Porphyromonas gingivalis]|uniref:hypothetical protein n=1 Tax=Porphyromonas gingivalis TaxID=837 RepID=UPI0009750284|nr:hypothetical protein [Porphyromonas gingivalis]ATR93280.1 hypothetical protein CS545_09520 [Porphyromonas gingivalis]ATS08283.1 hypothetical protein CS388_04050 [Porphyromonas gingivalis]SJL23439.1 hypothetical protein PGIN_3A1_00225 [Porphyromonas gingivalis]